jgi:hypothetical protein
MDGHRVAQMLDEACPVRVNGMIGRLADPGEVHRWQATALG